MSRVFAPALAVMRDQAERVFGPMSFQGYLAQNGFGDSNTAKHISVQSVRGLAAELRDAATMVFRLGSPSGQKHTHFALAKCINGWDDYFLLDDQVFGGCQPELFVPVSLRQLFAFSLLPKFTETSLVNLAIASGLLSHALALDDEVLPSAPATGQGTYSFAFLPHEVLKVEWQHAKGQVEIDAAFVAKRQGVETLFVIEAKSSDELDSLAKHKLAFPVQAMRMSVPNHMSVTPVYIRAVGRSDGIHFYIAECELSPMPGLGYCVSGLKATKARQFILLGFGPRLSPDFAGGQ